MTLNFWFSCLHLPSSGWELQECANGLGLYSAGHPTQGKRSTNPPTPSAIALCVHVCVLGLNPRPYTYQTSVLPLRHVIVFWKVMKASLQRCTADYYRKLNCYLGQCSAFGRKAFCSGWSLAPELDGGCFVVWLVKWDEIRTGCHVPSWSLGALPSEWPDGMEKPDFLSLYSGDAFPGRPQPGTAGWPAPPTS